IRYRNGHGHEGRSARVLLQLGSLGAEFGRSRDGDFFSRVYWSRPYPGKGQRFLWVRWRFQPAPGNFADMHGEFGVALDDIAEGDEGVLTGVRGAVVPVEILRRFVAGERTEIRPLEPLSVGLALTQRDDVRPRIAA